MNGEYSIRELSQEFEVTTRTLRFYEEKGLLSPTRAGQNRIYSAADRTRLILILRGKKLGLSLEQSADLIAMYDPDSNNKKQLEALIGYVLRLDRIPQDPAAGSVDHCAVTGDNTPKRVRVAFGSPLTEKL